LRQAKPAKEKKRPGPQPELVSLNPLGFDEAIDILVGKKPKKKPGEMISKQGKERSEDKESE
jgi:hypothetical protein